MISFNDKKIEFSKLFSLGFEDLFLQANWKIYPPNTFPRKIPFTSFPFLPRNEFGKNQNIYTYKLFGLRNIYYFFIYFFFWNDCDYHFEARTIGQEFVQYSLHGLIRFLPCPQVLFPHIELITTILLYHIYPILFIC